MAVIEGLVQVYEVGSRTPSIPDLGQMPDVVVITQEFQPLRRPTNIVAGEQTSIVAAGGLMQKRVLSHH